MFLAQCVCVARKQGCIRDFILRRLLYLIAADISQNHIHFKSKFHTGSSAQTELGTSASEWVLSVDGMTMVEGSGFVYAVSVLFAFHYAFNLQYHTEAEATLEFLQRYTKHTRTHIYTVKGWTSWFALGLVILKFIVIFNLYIICIKYPEYQSLRNWFFKNFIHATIQWPSFFSQCARVHWLWIWIEHMYNCISVLNSLVHIHHLICNLWQCAAQDRKTQTGAILTLLYLKNATILLSRR